MDQSPRQPFANLSTAATQHRLSRTLLPVRRMVGTVVLTGACLIGWSWLACESYSAPHGNRSAEIVPGTQRAIAALQARLHDDDLSVRLSAAEACLNIDAYHAPALRELLAAIDDDKAGIRYFAVNALGNAVIDNPQAQFALHWALTDSDSRVAVAASLNLSKQLDPADAALDTEPRLSPEEITQLIARLRDPSATARQTAAIKLGLCGPAAWKASTSLRKCLSDADPIVRLHVAHALWLIDHQAGPIVPELIKMLGTTTSPVGIAAVSVMGEMGSAASAALPRLFDLFAGSEVRERLHLACMIARIDPRNREMTKIVAAGLSESSRDVRYLAALALRCSSAGQQPGAERLLLTDAEFRGLRTEAAAEELNWLHARVENDRHALAAQSSSNFRQPDETAPPENAEDDVAPDAELQPYSEVEDRAPDSRNAALSFLGNAAQRAGQPAWSDVEDDGEPSIDRVAQADPSSKSSTTDDEFDPDEGLKAIGKVSASIRIKPSDQSPEKDQTEKRRPARNSLRFPGSDELPPVYAAGQMTADGPRQPENRAPIRGFPATGFGWDAPAVCFRPLYFEDINLERYGIHFGFCEIAVSTGLFTKDVLLLPYKLLVQPGCENIYTLGYERPSNCIPLHCFHAPCPVSPRCWIERHCYRPYRGACPWDRPDGVCDSDCGEEE